MELQDKHTEKGKYYTSAENYTNEDDHLKTFTFIDHSPKLKIYHYKKMTEEEFNDLKAEIDKEWKEKTEMILEIPAVYCLDIPGVKEGFYEECIKREDGKIKWDETYVRNKIDIDKGMYGSWSNYLMGGLWNNMIVHGELKTADDILECNYENVMSHKWEMFMRKY